MNSHRFSRQAGARGRRDLQPTVRLKLEALDDRRVPSTTVQLLKDIVPNNPGSLGNRTYHNAVLIQGGVAYFTASDPAHGNELWKTDGTEEGTVLVKDINPGVGSSEPDWFAPISDTAFVFAARTRVRVGVNAVTDLGVELWKSDGTEAGTVFVADIAPGAAGSDPQELIRVGDLVYFSATPVRGAPRQLFRTDGTRFGTSRVIRDGPGANPANPQQLTASALGLYFTAVTLDEGREPWRVDLGSGRSNLVRDIVPGQAGSNPRSLTAAGNTIFFSAQTPRAGGRELWWASGNFAGLVADLNGPTSGSDPRELTVFNNRLYFSARSDENAGRELHSVGNTFQVVMHEINPGIGGADPQNLTVSNGALYFGAQDGTHGRELWKTDGTASGPTMVRDINSRPRAGSPLHEFVDAGDTLFFLLDDGAHGEEVWESNGTELGTRMVADLYAGPAESIPSLLTAFGDRLFFFAREIGKGNEPHLAFTDRPPTIDPLVDRTDPEGAVIDIPLVVTDPDGDPLTVTAEQLPPGIALVPRGAGYALAGALARTAVGAYTPVLRATDGSREVTAAFSWTVLDDTPPTIDNPGLQGNNEGNVISLWVFARDVSGDPVTFSATGLPPGLTIDPVGFPLFGGAAISGTVDPHAGAGSPYTVTVTATDGSHPVSTTFTWTIGDFTAPVVTNPGPQRKNEGNLVSLQILASDAEGDSLAFTAENLPPGLVMFSEGIIFGRLTNRAAGTYHVTVHASDGQNTASTTFTWVVGDLNPPTVQHPGTQNSQAGAAVSLQIMADDADDDPLVYTAFGLPPGLAIDRDTGRISGTIAQEADGFYNVTVRVTDGTTEAQTHFVWNVQGLPHGGGLDPTFDEDGLATTPFGQNLDRAQATAVQHDGKVVAAGFTTNFIDGFHTGIALARYTTEGRLDETFGSGGRTVTDLSREDQAQAVLLQGDRILVAGFTSRATRDVVVLRYTPDGRLDTTFGDGGSGRIVLDFGGTDTAVALALQDDGQIVVGGSTQGPGFSDFALARLTADGQLDPGFGSGGKVITDLAGGPDVLTALAVQPDRAIVAVGSGQAVGVNQFASVRYLSDGTLDPTFGVDTGNGRTGKAFVPVGLDSGAVAVAVRPDGRLILGGNSYDTATGVRFTVLRMLANGDLDGTFGDNGVTTTNLSGANEVARAMAVQPDGKIVLGGRADGPGGADFALVRYTVDGQLDLSFDFDGVLTTDFGLDGADELYAMALDGTRLVAVGSASNGDDPGDFAVARYLL